MAPNERTPALAGVRGSGEIVAGSFDTPETINCESSFQAVGTVAARIVERIARKHALSRPHAKTAVELAGLGGAA